MYQNQNNANQQQNAGAQQNQQQSGNQCHTKLAGRKKAESRAGIGRAF